MVQAIRPRTSGSSRLMKISVWTDATFVLRREEGIVLYVAYVEASLPTSVFKAYAYTVVGGVLDNNDAEHYALLWANGLVNERFKFKESVAYYSDSQFAVNKLADAAGFDCSYNHVPRIENKVSPYLVAVSNEVRNFFRHDKAGMASKTVGKTFWKEL
jgi:hypothetical protein